MASTSYSHVSSNQMIVQTLQKMVALREEASQHACFLLCECLAARSMLLVNLGEISDLRILSCTLLKVNIDRQTGLRSHQMQSQGM